MHSPKIARYRMVMIVPTPVNPADGSGAPLRSFLPALRTRLGRGELPHLPPLVSSSFFSVPSSLRLPLRLRVSAVAFACARTRRARVARCYPYALPPTFGHLIHAAVLCPSFYKARILSNPSAWARFLARVRAAVIGVLQRRDARRRARFAF